MGKGGGIGVGNRLGEGNGEERGEDMESETVRQNKGVMGSSEMGKRYKHGKRGREEVKGEVIWMEEMGRTENE